MNKSDIQSDVLANPEVIVSRSPEIISQFEVLPSGPVAVDDFATTDEDTLLTGNVLTNDSDPDRDKLIVSAVNGNAADVGTQIILDSGAKLTLNPDGTFSYDPEELDDENKTNDLFTYTLSDRNGKSDTATVTVTVTDNDDEDDLFRSGKDESFSSLGNDNYAEILSFYGSSNFIMLKYTRSLKNKQDKKDK